MYKFIVFCLLLLGLISYGTMSNIKNVAILPTVGKTVTDSLLNILSENISYYAQWEDEVIYQKKVNKIYNVNIGCIETDCLQKMGKMVKADYIILTEATIVNKKIQLTLKLFEIDRSMILGEESIVSEEEVGERLDAFMIKVSNILKDFFIVVKEKKYILSKNQKDTIVNNNYWFLYSSGLITIGTITSAILFLYYNDTETETETIKLNKEIMLK